MPKKIDLTNQKFGKLTVLGEFSERSKQGLIRWVCLCDCGKITDMPITSSLKSGNTKSCGCISEEILLKRNYKHGFSGTPTYKSWLGMKERCYNKNSKSYHNYGGRGITVCNRWLESFENFLEDMGEKPNNLEIDRIDVNKNYEKENCRWVEESLQSWNQRIQKNNTSGKEGVKMAGNGWISEISINNNRIYLGYFSDFMQAVDCRESAEKLYYGGIKNEYRR